MLQSLFVGAFAALASIHGDPARGAVTSMAHAARAARATHVTRRATAAHSGPVADSIVVTKHAHTLTLFHEGVPVKSYRVALGKQPVGDKVRQGDDRTPEGLFHIDARNPESQYYKALHISYPDAAHQERARALGVPAGGDVMIHGLPDRFKNYGASQAEWDWTKGCIALSDQQMDEIWSAVPVGTPILILP